ncbi:heparan-alpha-glucosaminide N-acetyltransferase domain-containing protein [Niabella insulamsoli]|uniref:heparan-alpha-glucosaminide N-acetyltransferase domain-containing protein n=1 Tax=Niabella insulamsoli TaxID=3144874 RepID=UPI0031FD6DF5
MLSYSESRSLALARGSIVFLIAPIHCVMLYSTPTVKAGMLGRFMAFFAEYPGAHLFMFLMGFFISLSKAKPISAILKRSLLLLSAGYLLNAFKFVIPHWLGLLPRSFYVSNHIATDEFVACRLLLINDILQFAGVAYLICGLIKRSAYRLFIGAAALVLVLTLSPWIWERTGSNHILINAMLDLAGGFPPHAYFPIFPWLFHCLLGTLCGHIKNHYGISFKYLLFTGLMLTLMGTVIWFSEPASFHISFFRSGPGGTFIHGGVTLIFISLLDTLSKNKRDNPLFRFLSWCSRKITPIYLIQWVLIMWLLPITGYETLNQSQSLIMITMVSGFTFLLTNYLSPSKK